MEAFRTVVKGWLGKGLLVLFLTPLALVGIEGYFSGPNQAVAVEVNGESITRDEIDNWIKSQREQYLKSANGDESLLNTKVIEQQVYDAVILRAVLLQQAKKLGIQLSDEQLGVLLRQQGAFQRDGKFSQEAFEQYMAGTRTNMAQLLADFRQQTSLSLLTSSIINTALYSDKSADTLIQLLAQERTTHLAEIPLNGFATNFVATDAQIKAYYDKNAKNFVRTENVDLNYIVLNKDIFLSKVQVTEQDIEAKYQAYVASLAKDATREVSHILVDSSARGAEAAAKIANEIQAKLNQGESFEALVQQYSDDPLSKEAKGKLEGYSVGVFGDTFDKAVLGLSTGKVSAPIKTDAGYHLIRLDRIVAANILPLAEMREQLATEIKASQAENLYQDAINQGNELVLATDSLSSIAEQYQLPVKTLKGVVQNNSDAVLSDPALKVKVFSEEVRQGDRNTSTAITLKSGETVWFKVLEHHAERTQTIAEAKAVIQAKLKQEEQAKQAKASVDKVLKDLATKPAAEALVGSNLNFSNLGPVPRQSGLLPIELERAIYSVAAPKEGHWSVNTVTVGESLFVVGVSAIGQNPAFNINPEQKQQIVSRFDARGQQELNDYVEYLKAHAKIEKNEKK